MGKSNQTTASGGIGLTSLLTVAFVVLKLCGVIDWSWWWVLSPLWISTALGILLVFVMFVVISVRDKKGKNTA